VGGPNYNPKKCSNLQFVPETPKKRKKKSLLYNFFSKGEGKEKGQEERKYKLFKETSIHPSSSSYLQIDHRYYC
jgi:hypothetical protein